MARASVHPREQRFGFRVNHGFGFIRAREFLHCFDRIERQQRDVDLTSLFVLVLVLELDSFATRSRSRAGTPG